MFFEIGIGIHIAYICGYNICPKHAKDTSRCVFRDYMAPTQTSQSIEKGTWGSLASYSFFEHNFSSPCLRHSECQSNSCTSNKCAASSPPPKKADGEACSSNSECQSNICTSNQCAASSPPPKKVDGEACSSNSD